MDEESLRQFLILRRDALKGFRVEGMEFNNLVSSMLQDYAYILKGEVYDSNFHDIISEIIIKIPMEIQTEFENKYSINDLLIGHVSIVGIYKGVVQENHITSNTFTYFQEVGMLQTSKNENSTKIIKSNTHRTTKTIKSTNDDKEYHFVDVLSIIQGVTFKLENLSTLKFRWWNKLGIWLSKSGRKNR